MHSYNNFQKAFHHEVAHGTGNILLEAMAGSGKTFSIEGAVKLIPDAKVLYLVFSKVLAEEAKTKMPANVTVSTVSSFGLRVIKDNIGIGQTQFVRMDGNKKAYAYALALIESQRWDTKPKKDEKEDAAAKRMAYTLSSLSHIARLAMVKTPEDVIKLADHHGHPPCDPQTASHIIRLIQEMDKQEDKYRGSKIVGDFNKAPSVDFTDMVYYPAVKGDKWIFPQYDFVFVDEFQDFSPAMHGLLANMAKHHPTTRIIAVGDPRQAIFGFAGASHEAVEKGVEMFNMKVLSLPVNYRCGSEIIKKAQEYVPGIMAHEGAWQGAVKEGNQDDFTDGSLVLCRTTAPLVEECLQLISKGRKACVKGSDLGEELCKMWGRNLRESTYATVQAVDSEVQRLSDKLVADGKDPEDSGWYARQLAMAEVIGVIAGFIGSPIEFNPTAKSVFSDADSPDGVTFSTIHRAKGREADKVVYIDHDQTIRTKKQWQEVQETNLKYVAITRARHVLVMVDQKARKQYKAKGRELATAKI